MVAGYVRLSRDDNKKDYISIENQKLILTQYAGKLGLKIERWYEDDGVSGYTFERPGFIKLLADLEKDVDVILAKDLSRIGRHNARVLLFLEEIKEMGKRILLADDTYDSFLEEDDTLGIKTWYNERYVKDISKKIRKSIHARQQNGTLAITPPFGYLRDPKDKQLEIDNRAVDIVRRIFRLYIEGYGFRTISERLTQEGVPTASMFEKERIETFGRSCSKRVVRQWSPKMVGDIIKNDIYTGVIRFHKNERMTVHGKDKRVKPEDHIVFYNNHPVIIDPEIFQKAQELLLSRKRTAYRGIRDADKILYTNNTCTHNTHKSVNRYRGLLYCGYCHHPMTLIQRKDREPYYICSNYNTKGKQFCSCSRQIREAELDHCLSWYRNSLLKHNEKLTTQLWSQQINKERYQVDGRITDLQKEIFKEKEELKFLLLQLIVKYRESEEDKVNNERSNLEAEKDQSIMKEVIHELEKEKTNRICLLRNELEQWKKQYDDIPEKLDKELLELQTKKPSRQELELLIDKIEVEQEGGLRIFLRHDVYETGWYASDGIRIHSEKEWLGSQDGSYDHSEY